MKHIDDLLPYIDVKQRLGTPLSPELQSLCYDSRKVQAASLYVARTAVALDGHDFIEAAIAAGASVIVCERIPTLRSAQLESVLILRVEDSKSALARLSHAWFNFPARSMRMIGVTGTNGKTTCTLVLKQLLEGSGELVGLIGTTGNFIGSVREEALNTTPEAPELCALLERMRSAGVTSVVMEVSSHALVLKRVEGIEFCAALFTNLSQDHLDFHGTMDSYRDAKKHLFDTLPSTAVAIVNADDPYATTMLSNCVAQKRAIHRSQGLRMTDCAMSLIQSESFSVQGARFRLEGYEWHSPLLGGFNVDNLALCLLYCIHSGLDPHTLQRSVSKLQAAEGRMQRLRLSNGATVIIDYAHSPDALQKTLATVRALMSAGRLWCVFGAGGDRDRSKRPLMGSVAESLADVCVLTNDNPRYENPLHILDDIRAGMSHPNEHVVLPNRAEAIRFAVLQAGSDDCVVIAGKGHEQYQLSEGRKVHFSDVEEVLTADSTR